MYSWWKVKEIKWWVSHLWNTGPTFLDKQIYYSNHLNLIKWHWGFRVSDGGQEGQKNNVCVCEYLNLMRWGDVGFVFSRRMPSLHRCRFGSSKRCNLCCESVFYRKYGLNVLTWLACCAAPGSAGRVMQVLGCKVSIELWNWELSGEMGIAPCWFVTCAMMFGALGLYIHHWFNQNVWVARCVHGIT